MGNWDIKDESLLKLISMAFIQRMKVHKNHMLKSMYQMDG